MQRIIKIVEGTSVDGPGLRTSIYFAGCPHHCEGCHNPQSWSDEAGKDMTEDEVLEVIAYNNFPVTFSGGDPFYNPEATAFLAQRIKDELHQNIWCFTGYRWEQLIQEERFLPLLQHIDVLVDSPFILAQRNTQLRFRGSENQRIIDVPNSLKEGKLIDITEQYS